MRWKKEMRTKEYHFGEGIQGIKKPKRENCFKNSQKFGGKKLNKSCCLETN